MQVLESTINRVIEINGIKYYIEISMKWPGPKQVEATSMETKIKVSTNTTNDNFCIDIKQSYPADIGTLFSELQRIIQVVGGGVYQNPLPSASAPGPWPPAPSVALVPGSAISR